MLQPPVAAKSNQAAELSVVDDILTRSIASGNPLIAADYINQLTQSMSIKGLVRAKLLYGLRSNWELFRAAGIEEEFGDFVNAHMKISSQAADRYASMYEAVFVEAPIPEDLKNKLAQKPIKELLLLTAAVREGSVSEEKLQDVVLMDYGGIREIVREARGHATSSKNSVTARLVLRKEARYPQGSLVVFGPNNEQEVIGALKIKPETSSGKKFLVRMMNILDLKDIR